MSYALLGISFPTTVSPNDILTPYTPLATDATEAAVEVKSGDILKIQSVIPTSPESLC